MIKQTLKLIFLVLIFFPLTSFISPKSYATTLFSHDFNGTGELSEYDNNWHCLTTFSNNKGTPTCNGFKGGFQVITDHVMTSGFDPGYVYTGFQATDNVCVSVTFNWSEGGEWTAILLHADSDMANNKFYRE